MYPRVLNFNYLQQNAARLAESPSRVIDPVSSMRAIDVDWCIVRKDSIFTMRSAYDIVLCGRNSRVKRLLTAKVDQDGAGSGLSTCIVLSGVGATRSEVVNAVGVGTLPAYMCALAMNLDAEDRVAAMFSVGIGSLVLTPSVTIFEPSFLTTDIDLVVDTESDIGAVALRYAADSIRTVGRKPS